MANHSSIPAWEIPWTEEAGRLYSPWDCKESDMTEQLILLYTTTHFLSLEWYHLCISGCWCLSQKGVSLLRRKSRDKVGTVSAVG